MSDDQMREARRCLTALGQVLALCTLNKKSETALREIHARLAKALVVRGVLETPSPPPAPMSQ